jgi:hypothetical protein
VKREIIAVIDNPLCRTCGGSGSIPNPLSRPKTWRRLEAQAFKLVTNRPGISADRYPRAWRRLRKLRDIAARYQSCRACPQCVRRRAVTVEDVAKRLGVAKWHPHYAQIQQWVEMGVASWHWPENTGVLYTMEKVTRELAKPREIVPGFLPTVKL